MKLPISQSVWGGIASFFLTLAIVAQPVLATGLDTAPTPKDALAPYKALRTNAVAIQQELGKRVTLMEQQESKTHSQSNQLQLQLGKWLDQSKSIQADMNKAEADIRSKQSVVSDAQARRVQLEQRRQSIQREIKKKQDESITCYIPFAQLYCWIADLDGQLSSLDRQMVDTTRLFMDVTRDLNVAKIKLNELQRSMTILASNQASAHDSVDDCEKKLIALHAALAKYRPISETHRQVLGSFTTRLNEIDSIPPSERPGAIERRLSRLNQQLVGEIGQACQLLKSSGPLSDDVQKACAAN